MALQNINKKISNTILEHSKDTVFTLYSQNEVSIENLIKIDYLTDTLIKISCDYGCLTICGESLVFSGYGDGCANVKGKINSVEITGFSGGEANE